MHYFSNLFDKVLYMFRTVPLSIIRSSSTLYTRYFCWLFASTQPTEVAWQKPTRIACIQCWDTPGDGQWTCPKHVQYFINKFEKWYIFLAFIIRIKHSANACHTKTKFYFLNSWSVGVIPEGVGNLCLQLPKSVAVSQGTRRRGSLHTSHKKLPNICVSFQTQPNLFTACVVTRLIAVFWDVCAYTFCYLNILRAFMKMKVHSFVLTGRKCFIFIPRGAAAVPSNCVL